MLIEKVKWLIRADRLFDRRNMWIGKCAEHYGSRDPAVWRGDDTPCMMCGRRIQ